MCDVIVLFVNLRQRSTLLTLFWASNIGTGAAAESVFVCPSDCTSEVTCAAAAFGCKTATSRRFKFLFGSFSPAGYYFR